MNRIVFAPKGSPAPEGQGSDGSLCAKSMPKTAELTSNRINLEEMSSWKLEFEAEDNGGKIDVELSFDRGRSWRPAEKGKTYEVTPETKRVMFKFRLTAGGAAASQSPRLRKPILMEMPGR